MDLKMGKPARQALVNLVLLDKPWPYQLSDLTKCIRILEDIFSQ
jgi:hypothetical protein